MGDTPESRLLAGPGDPARCRVSCWGLALRERPWADGRAPRSPRRRPLLPSPSQAGVQGGLRGPAGVGAGGGRPEAARVRRAQRAAGRECPGALPGTTSSRKPSLTAPPAPPFPKAQLLPSLRRHSCVREPWLGRGLSLPLSQIPPRAQSCGDEGVEETRGPRCMGGSASWWGWGGVQGRLLVPGPEAAPPTLPTGRGSWEPGSGGPPAEPSGWGW